jgi:mRNA-degrading endonuclease RelE of RelBE toxin-antitoxin system
VVPDASSSRFSSLTIRSLQRRAVASLADQPYPEGAVAWGATSVYRLHAGNIRILYEVDDEIATVYIINIGVIS